MVNIRAASGLSSFTFEYEIILGHEWVQDGAITSYALLNPVLIVVLTTRPEQGLIADSSTSPSIFSTSSFRSFPPAIGEPSLNRTRDTTNCPTYRCTYYTWECICIATAFTWCSLKKTA